MHITQLKKMYDCDNLEVQSSSLGTLCIVDIPGCFTSKMQRLDDKMEKDHT